MKKKEQNILEELIKLKEYFENNNCDLECLNSKLEEFNNIYQKYIFNKFKNNEIDLLISYFLKKIDELIIIKETKKENFSPFLSEDQKKYIKFAEENALILIRNLKNILAFFQINDYEIKLRIKNFEKIVKKMNHILVNKGHNYNFDDIYEINDLAGIRICVSTEEEMNRIDACFESIFHVYFRDYFENPSKLGFKGRLYYLKLDEYFFNHPEWANLKLEWFRNYGIEVQVMTYEMEKIAEETHEQYDTDKYGKK